MAARALARLGLSRSLRRAQGPVSTVSDLTTIQHCLPQLLARSFSSSSSSNAFLVSGKASSLEACSWSLCPRTVAYSSLALESQEDEAVLQSAEIGYEVLGQYVPEGSRIHPQAAFAVVRIGSHQFKVTPGDMIYTEKLKFADVNDKLLLNKVLLMGSMKETIVGRPYVPEAGVLAAVEEIALDAKIIVFKKKRRKNYRRTNGHRQELTRLRILHIDGIETPSPLHIGGIETPSPPSNSENQGEVLV